MFSRWFILRVMLLFQVAISLLGNSGLHSALGCHHEHVGTEVCSSSKPASKHTSRSCCRHHSQTGTTSDEREPRHSHHPLTDDDCAICQFCIRPVEAAEYYQWNPLVMAFTHHHVEAAQQAGFLFELFYEVRGPPVVA